MKVPSKASDDGKVGIVVATYGGLEWREAGIEAAERSQQDDPNTKFGLYHFTGDALSLGGVRNTAAKRMKWIYDWDCEWYIFLDADDTLSPDYVTRMREGWGDIRQPLTLGRYADGTSDISPSRISRRRLIDSNFIVVGAMLNAEMFWAVKGFGRYTALEDWDLWLKMYCYLGAEIGESDAVYEVNFSNTESRNNGNNHTTQYNLIRRSHLQAFSQRGWK